ncbi:MAG: cupin domain-containing protein [Bacteroidota bacterium]
MSTIKIEKLSEEEIAERNIRKWPIWERRKSHFMELYDEEEQCLILEGEANIKTSQGIVTIKAGDFVTFPEGLKCVWDIISPIRRHYQIV